VNRLIILRAVFGWSGLTSAATQFISVCPVVTNAVPKSFCDGRLGQLVFEFKPMANIENNPAKLAEWATASHVEKHTPVPRAKPAAAPAK
jgi:hypothetical protein